MQIFVKSACKCGNPHALNGLAPGKKFEVESDIPGHLHYDVIEKTISSNGGPSLLKSDFRDHNYAIKVLWHPFLDEFAIESIYERVIESVCISTT